MFIGQLARGISQNWSTFEPSLCSYNLIKQLCNFNPTIFSFERKKSSKKSIFTSLSRNPINGDLQPKKPAPEVKSIND